VSIDQLSVSNFAIFVPSVRDDFNLACHQELQILWCSKFAMRTGTCDLNSNLSHHCASNTSRKMSIDVECVYATPTVQLSVGFSEMGE
jgi:hypothetical protein